ncbi:MAG: L-ribulose-5-phosphate 4-epimerase AraD [Clostridiales Family XIII bacterium]|nr:L-ribulose-5-phosphate 4-epimerase AraD [Clostridiales Family XIII bacterium]
MEKLKKNVYEANMLLPKNGLVIFTWGNVSEMDREAGLIGIKPSGVSYEDLRPEDIVVLDLSGRLVEGKMRASSDTATHLELYRAFPFLGGICHTHSRYATIFAQRKESILPFGTTHADYFHGAVPITRPLTAEEIADDYEQNTGKVIAECHPDPEGIPAVLVANHGPFTWGKNGKDAVHNATVLEEVALMALYCQGKDPVGSDILDKHYFRKHGANAYYGQ